MPNHNRNTMARELERHINGVENHRLTRDMMQHFDLGGLHPLAQPGRHHDHA
jgi:hypothetical protein